VRNKGHLVIGEFKEAVAKLLGEPINSFTLSDDVYLLFKRYDKDNDCKLNYAEFCCLLTSRGKEALMYSDLTSNSFGKKDK